MIILDATTKTLEIDLAGAITTSQLPVTVNYVDVTTTAYTPGSSDTATNSTTAVTIVSAPAASTQRQIKLLTVYNADTVPATVTIQLNNNATLRPLVVVVLAVGSTLVYTDGEGWRVLTSAGAIVTGETVIGTVSSMTSAQLAGILSDETGSGAAVFANSATLVSPALGTPASGVLTNVTGLPTTGLVDAAVTLAKMANLAQDQFIGRTTASTGVPETATITAAARTVLDDATVAAMVNTLGGAAAVGTGGLARATSPVFATQISTPAIVAPAALTITPAAGSGVNVVLSTTGDFAVNTDDLYVDTSTDNVGIGTTGPGQLLHIEKNQDIDTVLLVNNPNGGTLARSMIAVSNSGVLTDGFIAMGGTAYTGIPYWQDSFVMNAGATANGGLKIRAATGGIGFSTDGGTTTSNMFINSSGNVGIGTTGPTNLLSFGGNAARIFWMERNSVANTAGNTLTVQAGGATASATDKAGGDLLLQPGMSTGSAESGVQIYGVVAGASGTADRTQTKAIQVLGNKVGFYAVTPVVRPTALTAALTAITHTAPGTPDYALQDLTAGGFGFVTADEGNTALSVLVRTALRVEEIGTKLQALGLLT